MSRYLDEDIRRKERGEMDYSALLTFILPVTVALAYALSVWLLK